jgi:hypothetical protein
MSKRYYVLVWLAIAAMTLMTIPAMAQTRPFQLALVAPIQIFPENYSIAGIRINLIYGRNASVTGLDWGLINHTTSGVTTAAQFGLVGISDGDFVGWQNNWANVANKNFNGLQSGLVNYANNAKGLQFGFINYARKLNGLQIGLLNFIKTGGQFPVFPIVNWSF